MLVNNGERGRIVLWRIRRPPARLRTKPLARSRDCRAVRLASLPKAQPM